MIDYSPCSPNLLFKFMDFLQDEYKLGHGGRLGYIDAISDLMDFRKINGASDAVLRNLSATELYLKRARKTVAKMMRLQWSQDLDIDTLEERGDWATMDELLQVEIFHLPRFENTVKTHKNFPNQVNPSDLLHHVMITCTFICTLVYNSHMHLHCHARIQIVCIYCSQQLNVFSFQHATGQ